MLDFAPQNLSEYYRELLQNRFDIRSWFDYVAPLLKPQQPLDPAVAELRAFLEQICYENDWPISAVDLVDLEMYVT